MAGAPTPPLWIAAHEAGHAVALLALGGNIRQPLTSVRVYPYRGDPLWPYPWNGNTKGRLTGYKSAVVALSGPIAEYRVRRWKRGSIDDLLGADHMHATDDLLEAASEGEIADFNAASERAFREARRIVNRNWLAVRAVAREVQLHRWLTARRALQAIEDAGLPHPMDRMH